LDSDESQDQARHGQETEEEDNKKIMRKKTTKKRILSMAACYLFCQLGTLGSLINRAASMAKTVNDSKATRRQLEELQCHDAQWNKAANYFVPHKYGRGQYLSPYKRGQGSKL